MHVVAKRKTKTLAGMFILVSTLANLIANSQEITIWKVCQLFLWKRVLPNTLKNILYRYGLAEKSAAAVSYLLFFNVGSVEP